MRLQRLTGLQRQELEAEHIGPAAARSGSYQDRILGDAQEVIEIIREPT